MKEKDPNVMPVDRPTDCGPKFVNESTVQSKQESQQIALEVYRSERRVPRYCPKDDDPSFGSWTMREANTTEAPPAESPPRPMRFHDFDEYERRGQAAARLRNLTAAGDNLDLSKGGVKYDDGKPRWDLLPMDAVEEVVKVLTVGATKYDDYNWLGNGGMRWGRVIASLLRHITAWMRGRNLDPETGLSHMAHAGCCALFLLTYELRGVGHDDRNAGSRPLTPAVRTDEDHETSNP